jgi:hemoglobin/transferrin/lactoferrin receptor protein
MCADRHNRVGDRNGGEFSCITDCLGRTALLRRAAPLAALLGTSALAAPAAAQDNDGLYWAQRLHGGITVTATRTPVQAIDAPATITIITGEEIADQLATDIKDLVRFEPGVSVRRAPARFGAALGATGRARNEDFTIRGIGGNRVLIQVDGVRTPQGFSFGAQDSGRGGYTDIGLVKQVEILRGPASALYGSDGLSGVVSFTTSDPEDLIGDGGDIGGFVRAQFSSADNEFAETAAIAGRSGNLSAMLAYTRRDFEELKNKGTVGGTGESRTEPNPQDGSSDAFLGKLVWSDGGHRIRLTGEHLQSNLYSSVLSGLGETYLFGPPPSPPAWIVDRLEADDATERTRLSLDYRWEGDGLVDYANLAIYLQEGKDEQYTEEDRTPVLLPAPDRTRRNTFENRVWGIAAEARSDFDTGSIGHRLSYGADISWTNQKGVRDGTIPPSGETFPTSAFPETDFTLGGIFLGDEIALLDGALMLYPALRFDFYSLDPKNDPLLPTFTGASQSDSRLSPKIGAVAKLGEKVRLFANYAQGFRAPTPSQVNNFFENLASGYTSLPNPDLGPEHSESYEGGIRVLVGSLAVSATAFRADYTDFIDQQAVSGSFTPTDPAVFQFVNIGSVKVEGVEAKADLQLPGGFTGRFAIAYADGDEILPGGGTQPLASIDPLSLVAGIGYRALSGRFGGELILSHHTRKALEDTAGACSAECFRPEASTVLDLTLFYRPVDMLTLRAGIFNITDETYAYWSDVRGLASTSSVTGAYTRPGRNASVSLSFRF